MEEVNCMIPQEGDQILVHMIRMAIDGEFHTEFITFKKVSKFKNHILNDKFSYAYPEHAETWLKPQNHNMKSLLDKFEVDVVEDDV